MTKVIVFSQDTELIAQIQSLEAYEVTASHQSLEDFRSLPSDIDLIVLDIDLAPSVFHQIGTWYTRKMIVVGTLEQQGEIADYLNQGAANYFIKPVDSKLLYYCLQQVINTTTFYEVMSNFSSEIRTPLTPISGYIDLLNIVEIREKHLDEYLFRIWQNSERLKVAMNDFLEAISDFRERSNRYDYLKLMPCRVSSLVQEIEKQLFYSDGSKRGYIRKRVSVSTRIVENLPSVYVDCSSISSVLTHLIVYNFVKGAEYLHIDIEAYEANVSERQSVVIALRFNEKIVYLDDELESKYHGHFYTRRLIEANGGKLWYENRDEKTSFYVALPIYQPNQEVADV
jgi:signal transduction histidine kinase